MSKWYGNLENRLEEGKNYTGRAIEIGDDITMYLWSDRHCYWVSEVINQKRIKVKPYFVCADKEKADGMGHQEWKYFKTVQKYGEYWGQSQESIDRMKDAEREEVWVFRYGKWMEEHRHTEMKHPEDHGKRERDHFEKHGWYNTYHDLLGKVSFGVRDYYYDWEF